MSDIILSLENISKSFGEVEALRGVSVDVRRGEFITFLGPSGCGKTTMLRIIAGLETPDDGRVLLGGADVTGLEPNRRNVNTVFQSYALFPHMNVFQNIAYALRLRRVPKTEIARRVDEMLALVRLPGYEKRMPNELSGGQRQRVAIARAIIAKPEVLLLDEPLGALDLQLRRLMQKELSRMQRETGITFIYITHDQEEAINMSDRIAVMREGRFEQIGSPAEIYDRPRTVFVAGFLGTANIFTGTSAGERDCRMLADVCGSRMPVAAPPRDDGASVTFAVRSENLLITKHPDVHTSIPATVRESSYVGGTLKILLELDDGQALYAGRQGVSMGLSPDERVCIGWEAEHAVLLEEDTP